MGSALVLNAGLKGVAFAKNLKAHGLDVYLYDYRDGMLGLWLPGMQRYRGNNLYPHPQERPEAFCAFLLDLVDSVRPDILFAVNSSEINALYVVAGVYEYLCERVAFPSGSNYRSLCDKWDQYLELRDLLPMPPTTFFCDDVYVKPRDRTGGRGVRRLKASRGGLIVQKACEGVGVGYEALADKGVVIAAFMHERIREFPIKGGSSTARRMRWYPYIAQLSREAIGALKWTGFIMFEWKVGDKDVRLIELNPRPWGSIQLAIDAGVEFPWIAYRHFVLKVPVECGWKAHDVLREVETRVVPLDLLAGVQHLFVGDFVQFRDAFALWKRFKWEAAWPPTLWMGWFYWGVKALLLPVVRFLRRR